MNIGRIIGFKWTAAAILLFAFSTMTSAQVPDRTQSLSWLLRVPDPSAMLGIERMTGKSSMTISEDSVFMKFGSEPRVRTVDPDGPSAGKLRSGDLIVAIDNLLITTPRAGFRYANLVAGEPVELTIRRSGRLSTVTIVPIAAFKDDSLEISRLSHDLGRVADLIDSFVGSEPFDSAFFEYADWLPPSQALLGVTLVFYGRSVRQEDGTRLWRFDRPPQVTAIQPGVPV